jgi:hypothetical protein
VYSRDTGRGNSREGGGTSPRCEGQLRHRPERDAEVAPREALGAGAHCVGVVQQDNRGGGPGEAEHELALRFARR